jgi:hypothetical protein
VMKKAPLPIAFALLAAAGPAAAQAPAPAAVEERAAPAERRAPAAPRLNLKLDNAAQYTTEAPKEKDAGANLPVLGGNAVPYERAPRPRMEGTAPYPRDSESPR